MNKIITCLKNNKAKILIIATVICTVIYIFGNFFDICVYFFADSREVWFSRDFRTWLRDVFGFEKGGNIYYKIVDWSYWYMRHNRCATLLVIITIMMIGSLIAYRARNKKFNWLLAVYFIVCFLIMCFITFYVMPFYLDYYENLDE